jgi:hypothetical protein
MTPLNERPTPLTDAAKRPITANWNNEGDERRDVVFADFARTLERSLAERTEERDEAKHELTKARNALGAIYGTAERTVTEGIELLQSDFGNEKHHVTKLIMDDSFIIGRLSREDKQ